MSDTYHAESLRSSETILRLFILFVCSFRLLLNRMGCICRLRNNTKMSVHTRGWLWVTVIWQTHPLSPCYHATDVPAGTLTTRRLNWSQSAIILSDFVGLIIGLRNSLISSNYACFNAQWKLNYWNWKLRIRCFGLTWVNDVAAQNFISLDL